MGRVKVTPKGKIKKNIPITRVGKKQYLKRRFAHIRAVDVAGANNRFTQKYFDGNLTAAQSFTRLGLAIDPSAPKAVQETRQRAVKPGMRRRLEEAEEVAAAQAANQAGYIGRPVSEQEGSTIANLLQHYGTDLKRMALDPVRNPFQLNPRQLQRQIVNYLRWEKAAFPAAFAEAEAKGWFSVEAFADPKLRSGQRLGATVQAPGSEGEADSSAGQADNAKAKGKAKGEKRKGQTAMGRGSSRKATATPSSAKRVAPKRRAGVEG